MERKTPADYFQLYITTEVVSKWFTNTNLTGRNLANGRAWRDTTYNKMPAFLALVVLFGVVKYCETAIPWGSVPKYGNEWIKSTMETGRFDSILTGWSYVDTTMISDAERANKDRDNCFWTVQGFLDSFALCCRRYFKPYGRINVDERESLDSREDTALDVIF